MLGKVRIVAIAAATLLASPAFAGWPADQAAPLDLVGGQRRGALDRARQHSY
jgi:hypothetical protein